MKLIRPLILLLTLSLPVLLTACGQKGPLYLPEPAAASIRSLEPSS